MYVVLEANDWMVIGRLELQRERDTILAADPIPKIQLCERLPLFY
jgi:hypothetical protein